MAPRSWLSTPVTWDDQDRAKALAKLPTPTPTLNASKIRDIRPSGEMSYSIDFRGSPKNP